MVSIATLGMFNPLVNKQISYSGGIVEKEEHVKKRLNIHIKKIVSKKLHKCGLSVVANVIQ